MTPTMAVAKEKSKFIRTPFTLGRFRCDDCGNESTMAAASTAPNRDASASKNRNRVSSNFSPAFLLLKNSPVCTFYGSAALARLSSKDPPVRSDPSASKNRGENRHLASSASPLPGISEVQGSSEVPSDLPRTSIHSRLEESNRNESSSSLSEGGSRKSRSIKAQSKSRVMEAAATARTKMRAEIEARTCSSQRGTRGEDSTVAERNQNNEMEEEQKEADDVDELASNQIDDETTNVAANNDAENDVTVAALSSDYALTLESATLEDEPACLGSAATLKNVADASPATPPLRIGDAAPVSTDGQLQRPEVRRACSARLTSVVDRDEEDEEDDRVGDARGEETSMTASDFNRRRTDSFTSLTSKCDSHNDNNNNNDDDDKNKYNDSNGDGQGSKRKSNDRTEPKRETNRNAAVCECANGNPQLLQDVDQKIGPSARPSAENKKSIEDSNDDDLSSDFGYGYNHGWDGECPETESPWLWYRDAVWGCDEWEFDRDVERRRFKAYVAEYINERGGGVGTGAADGRGKKSSVNGKIVYRQGGGENQEVLRMDVRKKGGVFVVTWNHPKGEHPSYLLVVYPPMTADGDADAGADCGLCAREPECLCGTTPIFRRLIDGSASEAKYPASILRSGRSYVIEVVTLDQAREKSLGSSLVTFET